MYTHSRRLIIMVVAQDGPGEGAVRWCLAILAGLFWMGQAAIAAEIVRVGGYEFPPFVETEAGTPKGLTLDLIDALNKRQQDYEFRFVPISSRRRYADLGEARFDAMFFESPEWEWSAKGFPVDFTNVFLRGGEVFVAAAKPGRGQEFFADVKGKRVVGILGYHYGFANFNADPDVLARNFNMKLVNTHRSSIDMVLAERMDLGVVTDAYLWSYLSRNLDAGGKLLVSERYDQLYNHRVLVRRGGPLPVAAMNRLLAEMERDGVLEHLWHSAKVVR